MLSKRTLWQLPQDLITLVVREWIGEDIKDLCRLDAAICNVSLRPALLCAFAGHTLRNIQIPDSEDLAVGSFLWHRSRRLLFRCLSIDIRRLPTLLPTIKEFVDMPQVSQLSLAGILDTRLPTASPILKSVDTLIKALPKLQHLLVSAGRMEKILLPSQAENLLTLKVNLTSQEAVSFLLLVNFPCLHTFFADSNNLMEHQVMMLLNVNMPRLKRLTYEQLLPSAFFDTNRFNGWNPDAILPHLASQPSLCLEYFNFTSWYTRRLGTSDQMYSLLSMNGRSYLSDEIFLRAPYLRNVLLRGTATTFLAFVAALASLMECEFHQQLEAVDLNLDGPDISNRVQESNPYSTTVATSIFDATLTQYKAYFSSLTCKSLQPRSPSSLRNLSVSIRDSNLYDTILRAISPRHQCAHPLELLNLQYHCHSIDPTSSSLCDLLLIQPEPTSNQFPARHTVRLSSLTQLTLSSFVLSADEWVVILQQLPALLSLSADTTSAYAAECFREATELLLPDASQARLSDLKLSSFENDERTTRKFYSIPRPLLNHLSLSFNLPENDGEEDDMILLSCESSRFTSRTTLMLTHTFPNVRHLTLRGPLFRATTVHHLVDMLSAFQQLQVLHFERVMQIDPAADFMSALPSWLSLRRINCSIPCTATIHLTSTVRYLTNCCPRLRYLSMCRRPKATTTSDLKDVQSLQVKSSHNLEELLQLCRDDDDMGNRSPERSWALLLMQLSQKHCVVVID